MLNKEIVELGEQYQDLVENNEAFKNLVSQIHEKIEVNRGYLESFNVHGNSNEPIVYITTIQALNWVLDTIDEGVQRGLDEIRRAAIPPDPQDPAEGQSRR